LSKAAEWSEERKMGSVWPKPCKWAVGNIPIIGLLHETACLALFSLDLSPFLSDCEKCVFSVCVEDIRAWSNLRVC